jgi:hypothetical protein
MDINIAVHVEEATSLARCNSSNGTTWVRFDKVCFFVPDLERGMALADAINRCFAPATDAKCEAA